MKLTHIAIENILGVAQVDVALPTPVTAFCGANHAGKSSVREAIRAALLGMPERVLKKKDLGMLVHDDAKGGSVVLDINGGQATFTAPAGKQELVHDLKMADWERQRLALPYCLEPAAFAQTSADDRRQLLFTLTGATSNKDDIVAAMRERGLTDAVIESVTPMLRAGFQAAAKFAEERCRDAKASWKATTGETYGHVKAEGWAAPAGAPVDEAAISKLQAKADDLRHRIANGRTELGAAEQKLKAWLGTQENREADEKAFARLAAAQDKLARDEAELQQWAEQVQQLEQRAGTGPRIGLVHDLARAVKFLTDNYGGNLYEHAEALPAYEAQYGAVDAQADPEAAAKLPEARKARDLMQRSVDNDRRDIEAARAAGARLQQNVERGSQADVDRIRDFLLAAETELAQVSADLRNQQAAQQAAGQAQGRTKAAAAAHRDAQDWQAAVDALSSDGIPADILLKGLGPVNRILAGLQRTLNFPRVEIVNSDIDVYVGGRPYVLLSASERWRADAQIALALADLSDLKLVALDEFGILDLASRADCIAGLDALAEAGRIDTALVFGTFKKLPNFGSFPCVTGHWVEGGRIAESTAVAETTAA
ncbi:AAA family ATPase [uncultured Castellaniella sp.]|uniref:AAA family ATPase n=1 Tax=uncultured Castellaniella sp. TaxID=647907 RepID=UPI002639E29C|nr:AAA family ATPase [uncultured Castellaniella sp.]